MITHTTTIESLLAVRIAKGLPNSGLFSVLTSRICFLYRHGVWSETAEEEVPAEALEKEKEMKRGF